MSKKCLVCNEVKLDEEFYSNLGSKDKLGSYCKICHRQKGREWRKNNKEKTKITCSKWRKNNPDKVKAQNKRRWHKATWRTYHYKNKFGLSPEAVASMIESQNHLCAICGTSEPGGRGGNRPRKTFCLDHDHATGKVRQFLCTQCNSGLGHFKDSALIIRKAADYLDFHKNTSSSLDIVK